MKKRKNSLFYKNLKMFLLTILIPVLILGTFAFTIIYHYVQENSRNRALQSVEQMRQSMDLIADNIITLSENFSTDASPSMTLKRILQSDQLTYGNTLKLSMFKDILDATINFRAYIDSIYIYFPNSYNRFLASRQGIMILDNFPDTSWLERCDELQHNFQAAFDSQLREIPHEQPTGDTAVVSLYQKPFAIDLLHADGVIVLNLKYDYIQELLNASSFTGSQQIYLFNGRRELLVKSANADASINPAVWNLFDQASSQPSIISANGSTIAMVSSEHYDFTYVSVVSNDELYATPRLLFAFIVVLILFSLTTAISLAYRYSKKSGSYIDHIVSIIDAAKNNQPFPESLRPTDDEYNYIITSLLETFFKQHYLNIQLSEKNYRARTLELIALQAQINPHFLSNTLETIYLRALSLSGKPNAVTYLVENLSDILRYSLTNPASTVRFGDDLEYTRCYLNIQQFRYKDKFQIIWDCDPEVHEIHVIKLLLQPLIENSIYHGIKEKTGTGAIKLKCFLRNNTLKIHVIDNGKGMTKEQLRELKASLDAADERFEHIGLANTYKRLKLVYGPELHFAVYSRYLSGTAITISIPAE